jgi:hypothetical protein
MVKKNSEKDPEPKFGKIRHELIDKYRNEHFDSIHDLERVIVESEKLSKETKNSRGLKIIQKLIKRKKKELWKLKNRTAEVLRNAETMQQDLNSLKEIVSPSLGPTNRTLLS